MIFTNLGNCVNFQSKTFKGSSIKTLRRISSLSSSATKVPTEPFLVRTNSNGNVIEIRKRISSLEKPFKIEFTSPSFQLRLKQAKKELAVRAIGKADLIIDLTAGLGRDSMIFAGSGKQVIMVEESIILAGLLNSALQDFDRKFGSNDILRRVKLIEGNAAHCCNQIRELIDEEGTLKRSVSVYLDPMYPENPHTRKSLVKKETQWLHLLAKQYSMQGEEENNSTLFKIAKLFATDRIVVKRSISAPFLVKNIEPHASVYGRTQRFDIYLVNQLKE